MQDILKKTTQLHIQILLQAVVIKFPLRQWQSLQFRSPQFHPLGLSPFRLVPPCIAVETTALI